MTDPRTIDAYNDRSEEYEKKFDNDAPGPHLLAFMNMLPKGGSVLDLGCGTGGSCAHMVNSGFDVTGMDASKEMLKIAETKTEAKFIHATFDELNTTSFFDGIWANFSLLHAERSDLPKHLKSIHRALKPEGVFHIGMKTGDGSARDKIDRFYTYYTEAELLETLENAGFHDFQVKHGESPGLAGKVEPWMIVLAKSAT